MKKVCFIIGSLLILNSCSNSVGQLPSEELQKEKEFNELMRQVKETREQNALVSKKVSDKTTQIIEKTSETISSLKEENKKLKQEINESGKKYYPINDTISNFKFTLRPVSDGKENR